MGRGSKKARAERREEAQALGRPETGLAAYYSQKRDARDAERSAKAARSIAENECNYAFGARVERQVLAMARVIAELLAQREALESDPAYIHEQLLQESAKGFLAAQLAITRDSRARGVMRSWRDYGGEIGAQFASLSELPEPGAWDACPWELGLVELVGLDMPLDQAIRIGHAPGDRKQKRRERAREIRFYHPLGDERDPEGDAYFRLIGHIPANLPLPALKRTVRLLVQKWGEDPADWMRAKMDPQTGRPMVDSLGQTLFVPMFDRLEQKLNTQPNRKNEQKRAG